MSETLQLVSLIIVIVLNIVLLLTNLYNLRKQRHMFKKDRRGQMLEELNTLIGESDFSRNIMNKLEKIYDKQGTLNDALIHVLRRNLLELSERVIYINRKRNTKSSKWYDLEIRLAEYDILEQELDEGFRSYKELGGNHCIEERYSEAKEIIRLARRESEE